MLLDYVISMGCIFKDFDKYCALIFKKLETTDLSNISDVNCRENLLSFLNNVMINKNIDPLFINFLINKINGKNKK